jgi:tetratricopeptide (TPR) repeat protein
MLFAATANVGAANAPPSLGLAQANEDIAWGRSLASLHRYEEAEAAQRRALKNVSALFGAEAYENCLALDALGATLFETHRYQDAADIQRRALTLTERRYLRTHKVWADRAWLLVNSLVRISRDPAREEALPLLDQALDVLTDLDAEDSRLPEMQTTRNLIVAILNRDLH